MVLKEASATEDSKNSNGSVAQKATWTPKLHFAWSIVLSTLLDTRATTDASGFRRVTFADLWADAVDSE